MRLLLDTHAFLWFIWNHPNLSAAARNLIADPANTKFLSIASCWEMAVKISVGKLALADPLDVFMSREVPQNGLVILPVQLAHTAQVATLPLHHRDPFDRMLIAQAMVEQIDVVGADSHFDAYPVTRQW